MRVLIACEFSGVVRDAFRRRGHQAISCDLLFSERKGPHIRGDVLELISQRTFSLMIAHPPCQYLAVSGNRWLKRNRERRQKQIEAFEFVMSLALANIPRIAIEQPISILSTKWRKPDQTIQPWQFGHAENKKTCLWLKNLPLLTPTKIVYWKMKRRPIRLRDRVHHAVPGPNRWKERSRTYQGIADAMAEQWGACERIKNAQRQQRMFK